MAGSSVLPQKKYHVRSISLPARLHPTALKIEEELNKLKGTWDISPVSATPKNAETVQHSLADLVNLYNSVDELIQSSATQQALVLNQHEKLVEEVLDESVKLLDVCSAARDFLLMMKEGVNDLQSALRRKSSGDSSVETELSSYVSLRKKVKKDINKSVTELKKMDNKFASSSPMLDLGQHLSVVVRVLREVFCVTCSIFRSLLVFMSVSSSSKAMLSKWSLVSKLLNKGAEAGTCVAENSNEVVRADVAVTSLCDNIHHNKDADVTDKVKTTQKRLKALELSIETVDDGLGCMYRRLIRTRVSLLNILTQ